MLSRINQLDTSFGILFQKVNTASRIEASGRPRQIHISNETATILRNSGKKHWVKDRDDEVSAKGKGKLKTAWLSIREDPAYARMNSAVTSANDISEDKTQRLIDWNTRILYGLLQNVSTHRKLKNSLFAPESTKMVPVSGENSDDHLNPIDKIQEILHLPAADKRITESQMESERAELEEVVEDQLRKFIECIANLYRKNPFHNFEHAR